MSGGLGGDHRVIQTPAGIVVTSVAPAETGRKEEPTFDAPARKKGRQEHTGGVGFRSAPTASLLDRGHWAYRAVWHLVRKSARG